MNTLSHSSTGCAVLSADVAVGHLGAYLDHASELSCMVESPGDLSAQLAGQGLLSALVANGALSAHIGGHAQLAASIGDRARLRASVVCEIGEIPYLEIEPTYLWVIPEAFVDNDVFSNTFWHIS